MLIGCICVQNNIYSILWGLFEASNFWGNKMDRALKIGGLSGGLGMTGLVLGGPLGGVLGLLLGATIGNKQFPAGERPWSNMGALLEREEGERLEFKERFFENGGSKISAGIIKTIAGFANAKGGELLVGVCDDKSVAGINDEIASADGQDSLECSIRNVIKDSFDKNISHLCRIKFEIFDGSVVCRIEVGQSSKDIFANKKHEYYVRRGNQTQRLTTKEYSECRENEDE